MKKQGSALAPLLRAYRVSRGLTQAELGRIVGVGASAIGHYEQSRRVAKPLIARRLRDLMTAAALSDKERLS